MPAVQTILDDALGMRNAGDSEPLIGGSCTDDVVLIGIQSDPMPGGR